MDSTTWYLGTNENGESYKLAKYKDVSMSEYATSVNAKVGLLRVGELLPDGENTNVAYWTLTRVLTESKIQRIFRDGTISSSLPSLNFGEGDAITPSLNLKSNVIITSGDGTKNNPFTLELR